LGVGVVVHGGEGAEKETGEVAEDGGATGRNGVRSQERVEAAQRIADTLGVLEIARALLEVERVVIGAIGLRVAMAGQNMPRESMTQESH
jgi:hypothetical protein